jgi:hypothetical protein
MLSARQNRRRVRRLTLKACSDLRRERKPWTSVYDGGGSCVAKMVSTSLSLVSSLTLVPSLVTEKLSSTGTRLTGGPEGGSSFAFGSSASSSNNTILCLKTEKEWAGSWLGLKRWQNISPAAAWQNRLTLGFDHHLLYRVSSLKPLINLMFTRGLRVFSRPFVSRNTRFQPSVVLSARLPQTTTTAVRTMSSHGFGESTVRPQPDKVLQDIADYVHDFQVSSDLAWETARLCLIDTVGCGLEGLRFPECNRLMGPVVPGTVVPNGITLNYSSRYIKLMIRKVQKFLAQISSWTLFGVPSTLGP